MVDVSFNAIAGAVFAVATELISKGFEIRSVIYKVGICAEVHIP